MFTILKETNHLEKRNVLSVACPPLLFSLHLNVDFLALLWNLMQSQKCWKDFLLKCTLKFCHLLEVMFLILWVCMLLYLPEVPLFSFQITHTIFTECNELKKLCQIAWLWTRPMVCCLDGDTPCLVIKTEVIKWWIPQW